MGTTDPAGPVTNRRAGRESAPDRSPLPLPADSEQQEGTRPIEGAWMRNGNAAGEGGPVPGLAPPSFQRPEPAQPGGRGGVILRIVFFVLALYIFFFSVDLIGIAFKLMGKGVAMALLETASDPVAGLLIGLLVTSLVQSSSCTTSIVVGLVAAGAIDLPLAIPIIMGANIGTTVTNTIVSMGHVMRPGEFERAFAAGTVHDFFNVLAVLVLFPIEMLFHPVQHVALAMEGVFEGVGGVYLMSPLQAVIKPATEGIAHLLPYAVPLVILALVTLFVSLSQMVRVMRLLVMTRVEGLFDRVLFRNDIAGFLLGCALTAAVQSSSATTSIVVPLVGTGVLTVRKIFPYTLGANLGTTVTALLAALATGNPAAVTVGFAHMAFNIFGIGLFYPLKSLPIALATKVGSLAARSRRHVVLVISVYIAAYVLPIVYILFRHTAGR